MNYKKVENSAKLKARKRSVYGPFWRSRRAVKRLIMKPHSTSQIHIFKALRLGCYLKVTLKSSVFVANSGKFGGKLVFLRPHSHSSL